ncbi:hypothetical protein K3V69_14815, partial [Listeria monocytogenes]|nr:hypothetical protein [Listeria monocytogenes]
MTTLVSNPAHIWPDAIAPHARHADAAVSTPTAGTITFRNVGKTYRAAAGDVHALQGIDLDIP